MQPPPPPPPEPYGCTALGLGPDSLSCLDLSLLLLYVIFLAGLVWAAVHWRVFAHSSTQHQADSTSGVDTTPLLNSEDNMDGLGRKHSDDAEQSYSPLEQRLRPLFYKLVHSILLDLPAASTAVSSANCFCAPVHFCASGMPPVKSCLGKGLHASLCDASVSVDHDLS